MFEDLMGFNQGALIEDPGTKEGLRLWIERVTAFYGGGPEAGGGVDVEIIEGMLALTDETREYIYEGDFTTHELAYEAGSRPALEAVLADIIDDDMSDRDKVLAIMRRCRDNRDTGTGNPPGLGGTEEDILSRGSVVCQEISRVFACLCQMTGIPARITCAHISGHMMGEAFVDGAWIWIDPEHGCYCVKPDGAIASAWEIWQDSTIFERQPDEVLADCRPSGPFTERDAGAKLVASANRAYRIAEYRDCYFNPREAIAVGNYFVWDHDKYGYPCITESADRDRLFLSNFKAAANRREMNWPDFYFNHRLLDWAPPAE